MARQYDLVRRGAADRNPLRGLDWENIDGAVEEAGGAVIDKITQIRDGLIQWIKETTGIDLSGIAEFGDAIFAAIAEQLNLPATSDVMQLLQGLVTLNPTNFLDHLADLVDGDLDEGVAAIFGRLQDRLAGLSLDGGLDASKLFGDLPGELVDGLRALISAVFDPSWLSNIVPGQVGTGWSENLLTNPLFDGVISLLSEAGWEHDGTVFPAGAKGSAKVVADGTRKTLSNKVIRGSDGQTLRAGGDVEWSGPAPTVGRAFTVEVRPFTAAGAELPPVDVVGITNPAASSSGGFQTITADLPWPAGAAWVRTRIAVEAAVPVGTVARWSNLNTRKGGFMPQDRIKDLPADLADLINRFLGVGNALNGFLRGLGAPSSGGAADPLLDWVRDALGQFTVRTNTTSTTADQAHGVGSNALTNTVSIQAQLQDVQSVQDAGWTARPLWASMDYTADATFPLYLMQRNTSHSHSWSGSLGGSTGSSGGSVSISISGTTSTESAGGSSHSHSFSGSDSENIAHTHSLSGGTVSGSNSSTSAEYGAYTFTSSQAYVGFIRCGSVQEKRLFSFRGYYTAAVGDLRLDIYRLDKATGTMTLLHTSSNLAGALTTSAQWIQYVIPAGTAGINVQPGDILGVQFRISSGTMALQGIDSLLTDNPPGFLPRRVGMLRSGTITAPATMAESVWSAGAGFVPYIECGIDTGQASAPLSIADNFDGSLSRLWMMTGVNEIGIASNNIGIVQSGTNLADGWAWGKFNTQLRTDQSEVGISVTGISAEEQVVWFKGGGPAHHVGLAISSGYAVLYTMLGGTRTNRTSIAIGTSDADFKVRYTAATKVFAVYRNGAQIGSWTDSGNVAPTGLGNRFGGVGLHATRGPWFGIGSTKANPIDNWLLADV